jgi:uncharacterized membrane protein (GlpM family)
MRFLLKTLISALVIAGVSELGKKSSGIAAILAALPLTTILALIWLYADTRDAERAAQLSLSVFWAVLPSFIFFLSLPLLIRRGVAFPPAMAIACGLMIAGYWGYVWVLGRLGISV